MIGSAVSPQGTSVTHISSPRKREVSGEGPMKPDDRNRMVSRKDVAGESITVALERMSENEGARLNVFDEPVI